MNSKFVLTSMEGWGGRGQVGGLALEEGDVPEEGRAAPRESGDGGSTGGGGGGDRALRTETFKKTARLGVAESPGAPVSPLHRELDALCLVRRHDSADRRPAVLYIDFPRHPRDHGRSRCRDHDVGHFSSTGRGLTVVLSSGSRAGLAGTRSRYHDSKEHVGAINASSTA